MNKITKVDIRPIIATLYNIAIPKYHYKTTELPQEIADIGEDNDIFYDKCVTVEDHVEQQRWAFVRLLDRQDITTTEMYMRLSDIMDTILFPVVVVGTFRETLWNIGRLMGCTMLG